jgi:hypothetical protein
MQGQITLSKKKNIISFYFTDAFGSTYIFRGYLFKRFESPFSDEDVISLQNLEQKQNLIRNSTVSK